VQSNPMLLEIKSIPDLIRHQFYNLEDTVGQVFSPGLCRSIEHIHLCGCGDSHHAALSSELAFESLAGIATEPQTALQFARYSVGFLPTEASSNLVIGISVSGEVARTIEALRLSNTCSAYTIALTANPSSRLAGTANKILPACAPPVHSPPDLAVPGIRSYVVNLLALYLSAILIGERRGELTSTRADSLRGELLSLSDAAESAVTINLEAANHILPDWREENFFVYTGAGPNFGTASYSAAKMLEASGDFVSAVDLEEWAHLQYFARHETTPTFIISAGERDRSRALEIAHAGIGIGRHVALVMPQGFGSQLGGACLHFPIPDGIPEVFSPLIAWIPGALVAALRAELSGEPYFRAFSGGRNPEGGGGLSRIQTSQILDVASNSSQE
jgi:glucosamine--fructose-6-phosphate aminotransferase (isomerizing)